VNVSVLLLVFFSEAVVKWEEDFCLKHSSCMKPFAVPVNDNSSTSGCCLASRQELQKERQHSEKRSLPSSCLTRLQVSQEKSVGTLMCLFLWET